MIALSLCLADIFAAYLKAVNIARDFAVIAVVTTSYALPNYAKYLK